MTEQNGDWAGAVGDGFWDWRGEYFLELRTALPPDGVQKAIRIFEAVD